MEMLRCTKCYELFKLIETVKEFSKCPECGIGFLVGGHFAKTGKSAIESFTGLDPDDFFASDYNDELNDENRICNKEGCDGFCGDVHLDLPEWNLLLSTSDIENQRFAVRTAEKFSLKEFEKMDEIFYNTFRIRELSD